MMMFGMPSFMELLLLLSISGGPGLPIAVPPLAEDPLMARIAAEECLFYTSWSGVDRPDASRGNPTEALLAEKEIQQALIGAEQVVLRALQRAAEDGDQAQAVLLGELFPQLGKLALTRPACFYVNSFKLKDDEALDVQAGLVVRVEEEGPEIRRIMEKLENAVVGSDFVEIQADGGTHHQFQIRAELPRVTWGIRGNYLIVCVGKNALPDLFDSVRAGTPKWLTELRKQLPVERVSTVSYADLQKFLDLLKFPGPAPVAMMLEVGGFRQLTTYRSVTGLEKTGFVYRTSIGIEGAPTGLLTLLDVDPLAKDDLARIPIDTPAAVALRLNPEKTYTSFVKMIASLNGLAAADMEAMIEASAAKLGFKVREQLVASLGDHAYIYAAPDDGDLITGWTAVVQIRDHMTLFQVHRFLVNALQEELRGAAERGVRRMPTLKSMLVDHHTVYFLSVPDDDMPFSPSWCLTRDGIVFGLFPQAVKAHILRDAASQSLVNHAALAERLQGGKDGPVAFAYFDSKRVFELLYPLVQVGLQAAANELGREGFELDVSFLPSVACITKHLRPRVAVVRRTVSGIEIEGQQTIPGGTLGAAAPLLASATLPAMITARTTARRLQAQGQMRQITLALHNFHNTHKGFPAAYSIDKEGNPLLSWRVHILPYLEQQELYDRFHLDEPWDSEHNKKLVETTPDIYRSPASHARAGQTNFLVVRGVHAAIAPPNTAQKGTLIPIGIPIRDITDGTSNTVMLLEANDTSTVAWTQPADFVADAKEFKTSLSGLHPRGFHVGLADGSVRLVRQDTSTETLRLLFDRRDGKAIGKDWFDHAHDGRIDHAHVDDLEVPADLERVLEPEPKE